MAKKKRQGDPSRDGCESTDSEDGRGPDDRPLASCPHVGKAANLAAVKKTLKIAWVKVGQCTQCNKESKVVSPVKKLERDPRLRKELGGKLSLAEIKKEQLERAKAEQRAAAEKLKKEREQKERQAEEAAKEEEAKKNEASENKAEDQAEGAKKEEVPKKAELPSIWLCLKCGSQGCANNDKKHSFGHYKAPRSDLHSLVVNIASWSIWCYECQLEIYVDSHKKLYEAVEYIKKIKEQGVKQVTIAPKGNAAFGTIQPLALGRALAGGATGSATYTKGGLLRVKGLSNLGNTCFFNSVMQCLNQTHLLTHLLDLQAAKGVSLDVPGFEAGAASTNDDSEASDAEPEKIFESFAGLSVQLAEGGPMVTSLANFFKEMHNAGKTTTFSPGHLFTQVVRQAPKFRGMQQQDSHELLRYLLDGLRGEEQRRQKSAILKHFGLTEKTDPKSVARSLRRKLQVYGRQANHTLLDRIFSGQLVSTIVCEECHHSSRRYEQFLDISLPVVEDAARHKPSPKRTQAAAAAALPNDGEGKVTCCGVREERKSKGLAKKEKERRRKDKRNKGRKNSGHKSVAREDGELQKIREELQGTEKFEATEQEGRQEEQEGRQEKQEGRQEEQEGRQEQDLSDARVITSTGFHRQESIDLGPWKDKDGEEEEGYEEGEEEGQPETEEDWEWDYGETNEDKQTVKTKNGAKLDVKGEESDYIDTSEQDVTFKHDDDDREKSSEKTAENSDEDVDSRMGEDEEEEEEETGASSNGDVEDNDEDEVNKKWVVDKNYLSNLKKLDDLMNLTSNLDPRMASLCRGMAELSTGRARREAERSRVEAEWTARTLATLAPRYQATPGECSIYSCLNSFTQSELLTGSNKWACDRCTELRAAAGQQENSESGEGKKAKPATVYSSASKQMLVLSPPAVLTLQLKRFQQTISGCKKVNKHVSFPLELDLAAFCSSTCVAMPNMELGGKVAYSLYGVVEHSGSLRGGHYVAYVKARPASRLAGKEAFFNPPLAKPTDIPSFLAEIDRKLRKNTAAVIGDLKATEQEAKVAEDETNNNTMPNTAAAAARKWFFVSDSSVSEVAEEKVLRSQAYLLFYERTL